MHDAVGRPNLRKQKRGFVGLSRIVVGQQVSAASARAIWSRVEQSITPFEPVTLLAMQDEDFAGLGLSQPKRRTLVALAEALHDKSLNLANEAKQSDETLRDALMQIKGIGPWTADIYAIFSLARADAFAPGDLALQLTAMELLELGTRPNPDQLNEISHRWRPNRGVAARLMWAYYETVIKKS